jgi:GT2 family glycosyltransferase
VSRIAADRVCAVAIGRNEGDRLRDCLAALRGQAALLVYVDSGSTDDSVATARRAGAEIVELDPARPFSAARARNAGLQRMHELRPELEYVQFVDGDCVLDPTWLETAVRFLDENPDFAVACGRRRERHPDSSRYNRLCDMEWNTPSGEAAACGGDSLIRSSALRQVDGFDAALIAGEEPELCYRLRAAGWRIVRLDAEMTLHDAAMTSFGQWWRRTVRSGYAYAEGMAMHGRGPERYGVDESLRIWLWAAGLPTLIVFAASVTSGWSAALLLLYPLLVLRVARRRAARGDSWGEALLYGLFLSIGRWAQLLGQLCYLADRVLQRRRRLIEYKQPAG